MAKKTSKSRLDAIKAKLKNTDLGGGGTEFWSPKPGDNLIRILPGVGEMEDIFWVQLGTHYVSVGSSKKFWRCPDFTEGAGEPCPICEFVSSLYNTGDKADKALAQDIRVSRAYAMNIVVRDEEEKGPQVWTPGIMIFRQIAALLRDPDYGDLIIDPDDGLDLVIHKEGTMRQTTYTVTAKRRTTPLHKDANKAQQWIDDAIDLTPVWLSEDPEEDDESYKDESGNVIAAFGVLTYDRIKQEFEGLEDETEDDEEDEDDLEDDEEDEPEEDGYDNVKQAISNRRRSRTSSKPKASAPRRRSR